MCGIAGILYRDRETPVDKDLLRAMTDVIRHRGPDGEGVHIAPGLGLGHRRLAIIDPATGQQPMLDPDTQNVIIYNGEVYNYVEIRKELLAAGYHFRTDSDTEVILKAYAHWGEECLSRFNGVSRSGIMPGSDYSSPVTGLASSPCTTALRMSASCSARR